jgi:hypothetical protein
LMPIDPRKMGREFFNPNDHGRTTCRALHLTFSSMRTDNIFRLQDSHNGRQLRRLHGDAERGLSRRMQCLCRSKLSPSMQWASPRSQRPN